MTESAERRFIRVISGEARGIAPALARAALAVAEPFYAAALSLRNAMFDAGLRKTHRLPRPVVSVGNLTTGGTGKTPVVAWLVQALAPQFTSIAVLTRGYKGTAPGQSDEANLLRHMLGENVHVCVGGDRVDTALNALSRYPGIELFVMDDGFQHRRLHRDFDLVLIDATNPFGFNHVLPRGLLREPTRGLRRASAILITKADQVDSTNLREIERRCAAVTSAPIFRAAHQLTCLRMAGKTEPIAAIAGVRVVAFAGIGNPESFAELLRRAGAEIAATRWFPDHHPYSRADLEQLRQLRQRAQADLLVTTEKDAVRIGDSMPELSVAEMSLRFEPDHEARLLTLVAQSLRRWTPGRA